MRLSEVFEEIFRRREQEANGAVDDVAATFRRLAQLERTAEEEELAARRDRRPRPRRAE